MLYSPALQRTPLGTETQYSGALRVRDLGYRRYEWKCDCLTPPRAGRRVVTASFTRHLSPVHDRQEGRNRDDAWFSMLDGEWPVRKRNFERWLEPDNFDADGVQKLSLAALNAAGGQDEQQAGR